MRARSSLCLVDSAHFVPNFPAGYRVVWCDAVILTLAVWMTACAGTSSPPPPPVLSIATPSALDGTLGAAYSQTVQATGGVAPFNWSVSSGALPHNLTLGPSLTNSVMIAGTP